jgi:hypothetical protein
MTVILFGHRLFAEIIKLRISHEIFQVLAGTLNSMTKKAQKRRRLRDTEGSPHEERGRDCSDASTIQHMPRVAGSHQLGEDWNRFSLRASEGTISADTCILHFQNSERGNKLLLF